MTRCEMCSYFGVRQQQRVLRECQWQREQQQQEQCVCCVPGPGDNSWEHYV